MREGAAKLSTAELLAILFRTGQGSKSVMTLSAEVLAYCRRQSDAPQNLSVEELMQIDGIGPAKAATVVAALEFARRLAPAPRQQKVDAPKRAWHLMRGRLSELQVEEFWTVLLDTKKMLIKSVCVSSGTLNQTPVHPREVFAGAIRARRIR